MRPTTTAYLTRRLRWPRECPRSTRPTACAAAAIVGAPRAAAAPASSACTPSPVFSSTGLCRSRLPSRSPRRRRAGRKTEVHQVINASAARAPGTRSATRSALPRPQRPSAPVNALIRLLHGTHCCIDPRVLLVLVLVVLLVLVVAAHQAQPCNSSFGKRAVPMHVYGRRTAAAVRHRLVVIVIHHVHGVIDTGEVHLHVVRVRRTRRRRGVLLYGRTTSAAAGRRTSRTRASVPRGGVAAAAAACLPSGLLPCARQPGHPQLVVVEHRGTLRLHAVLRSGFLHLP